MDARLTRNTELNVGPIDSRIFGGFLEHLGRAVYGVRMTLGTRSATSVASGET